MSIRAVLFDLDGVLLDAVEVHYRSLNLSLVEHKFPRIEIEEHTLTMNGLPTREKLKKMVEDGRVIPHMVDSVIRLKQQYTTAFMRELVRPSPNLYCLVAGLREKGLYWGVVSNAVADTVWLGLKLLGLQVPKVVISNESCTPKPSPEPYKKACELLRILPQEALAVEDGNYGVKSATDAGCKVLRVRCPDEVTPNLIWSNL